MKRALFIAAAIAVSAAFISPPALAGDWGGPCGGCMFGGYAGGATQVAPPTYVYAPPTVTIVPRYVVQPNVIVRRTYLLRPTQVVDEAAAPCVSGCGGYVVDQGQFYGRPAPLQPVDVTTEWQTPGAYYVRHHRHRSYSYPQHYRSRYTGYHRSQHYRRYW